MSAPSAINTDMSTVKFENETIEWNGNEKSLPKNATRYDKYLQKKFYSCYSMAMLNDFTWRSTVCVCSRRRKILDFQRFICNTRHIIIILLLKINVFN